MTKQEAINYLKNSMAISEDDDSRYHNEVLDFIIKALEQEPCVTMRDLSDKELKHFVEEMKKVRPQANFRCVAVCKSKAKRTDPPKPKAY